METSLPREVSVVEPIGSAIEKTREILFRPFDLGKWFTIGFCAWLATLGEGGGNFNFDGGGGGPHSGGQSQDFHQELHNLKEGFLENLHIIIPIAIVVVLIIVAISLLVMWLTSRGKFMFLHCVARNVAEVKNPWKRYASQANSLFLFRLVLAFVGMMTGLLFVVPIVLLIIPMVQSDFQALMFAPIAAIALLILFAIIIGLVFSVIMTLTDDFVVPVMYINNCTLVEGWRSFWQLCKANKGKFFLFLLFLILVNIVLGVITFAIVVGACCLCCIGIIFMIPYIGTVALLPIHVWRRAYSALFFAQFGPQFDVFAQTDPVVVPTDAIPVTPPQPPAE